MMIGGWKLWKWFTLAIERNQPSGSKWAWGDRSDQQPLFDIIGTWKKIGHYLDIIDTWKKIGHNVTLIGTWGKKWP